jgi:transposase InsO family protein
VLVTSHPVALPGHQKWRTTDAGSTTSSGFCRYYGSEWGTDFTWHLHDLGIAHTHIPPGCLASNGKVERSHRTDEDESYRRVTFTTPPELVRKLRAWGHEYNHRRLHPALAGKTPAERLAELRISPVAGVLRSA